MGTAFAGRSSSAEDASTVYGNPAGMSRLKRGQVSGGLALIYAKTAIDDRQRQFFRRQRRRHGAAGRRAHGLLRQAAG